MARLEGRIDLCRRRQSSLYQVQRWPGSCCKKPEVDVLPAGTYRTITLSEPTKDRAIFETTVTLALADKAVHVYASLRLGGSSQQPLSPLIYDVHCPRVVRDFIGYALPWHYSGDPISKGSEKKRGGIEGETLAGMIVSPTRMLPLVVVSEHLGFVLHPDITENLGRELIGLAHVYQLDGEASWGLTRILGEQWSCYNGAIRLYWPHLNTSGDPFAHPLWTARKLLDFDPDTRISADRLCDHLRRRLMELSSFLVREPTVILSLSTLDRDKRFDVERKRLEEASEFRELAESYAAEVAELRAALADKQGKIEDLQTQVENLNYAFQWKSQGEDREIAPEIETPPATIKEAVQIAESETSDVLYFGRDVSHGVEGLSSQAGPPEKVLHYLRVLAKWGRAKQSGPVGTSMIEWFRGENVKASQEYPVVRNSSEERAKRTFNDGQVDRFFEWHLKPVEAVSPDKCVRIYFDWSDERKRVIVGWIGRHP